MGFARSARGAAFVFRSAQIHTNMNEEFLNNVENEYLLVEVLATVLGPNFDINFKFAKTTPFASPFIYFQCDPRAQPFAVVDRAWKRVVFFNVEGEGRLAVSLLERWFPQHLILYFNDFSLQGQTAALTFASRLCLTGIATDLPLDVILENQVEFVPIAKPEYNQRHILQKFGYTFIDAPISSTRCGEFFGEFFNVTNHILFFLQLKKQCKSLEKEDILRRHGTAFDEKFDYQLACFKEFAAMAANLYLQEPLLFSVIYETPRKLKLGRYKTGTGILAQLSRTEIVRLARILFMRNLDNTGRLKRLE